MDVYDWFRTAQRISKDLDILSDRKHVGDVLASVEEHMSVYRSVFIGKVYEFQRMTVEAFDEDFSKRRQILLDMLKKP
jgi:hypothetical protein